ncbi:MAG TPA: hypothetical protein PKN95_03880 [Verrucomicrobiota bacterium]|nr:hypothetical protein [Verrucomicrobiota bacterium]HNT13653.1 hypothetical protein [Verrucomicrobiota bacterium]
MQRPQLEHIIRAAIGITGATEIVVIGSQALLGQFPHAPTALLVSIEADVFTFRDPADADLIDGSIGEGSPFHQTFGYYAHGVAEETAILPPGWKERLVRLQNSNTGNGCGLCLEAHDLAVAKLAAGREKDTAYVAELLRHKLVDPAQVESRLRLTNLNGERLDVALARLKRLSADPG